MSKGNKDSNLGEKITHWKIAQKYGECFHIINL